MKQTLWLLIFLFLSFSPLSIAEIYSWQDDNGNIVFGDAPISQPSDPIETSPTNTFTPSKPITITPIITQPKVVLYTTSWCGFCRKARNYFSALGIKFVDYDIEKNMAAAQRKRKYDLKHRAGGVPMVIVNKKVIYGFRPDEYQKALNTN